MLIAGSSQPIFSQRHAVTVVLPIPRQKFARDVNGDSWFPDAGASASCNDMRCSGITKRGTLENHLAEVGGERVFTWALAWF